MINVIHATHEDADALLALIDALADYEHLPRPDDAARTRLVADAFETVPPRFEAFLAWQGERPVGYAITFMTYSTFLAKPTLYIEDIFVLDEARGIGAGNALFNHLRAIATERGCGRIEWTCLDWNRLAIDFYEKRGAKHLEEWRIYRLDEAAIRHE